jgi:hypothetical protein
MNEFFESRLNINRRHFLGKAALGLGSVALGSLLIPGLDRYSPFCSESETRNLSFSKRCALAA